MGYKSSGSSLEQRLVLCPRQAIDTKGWFHLKFSPRETFKGWSRLRPISNLFVLIFWLLAGISEELLWATFSQKIFGHQNLSDSNQEWEDGWSGFSEFSVVIWFGPLSKSEWWGSIVNSLFILILWHVLWALLPEFLPRLSWGIEESLLNPTELRVSQGERLKDYLTKRSDPARINPRFLWVSVADPWVLFQSGVEPNRECECETLSLECFWVFIEQKPNGPSGGSIRNESEVTFKYLSGLFLEISQSASISKERRGWKCQLHNPSRSIGAELYRDAERVRPNRPKVVESFQWELNNGKFSEYLPYSESWSWGSGSNERDRGQALSDFLKSVSVWSTP